MSRSERPVTADGRLIVTTHIYPPIPDRRFDWQATIDDSESGPAGFGRTEAEAIADLHETLEEEVCNVCRRTLAYYTPGLSCWYSDCPNGADL